MSAPQPLHERIIDCLRAHGPIAAREWRNWLGDVDHIVLDATISRLVRQNSVSLAFGKYELIAQRPVSAGEPFIGAATSEGSPSAAEEAAASLAGIEPTAYCIACNASHPESEFPRSKLGKLYSRCKKTYGEMSSKGKQAAKARRLSGSEDLQGPQGECLDEGTTSELVSVPIGRPSESPVLNTTPEASAVSPQTSLDTEPLPAADGAGRSGAVMADSLEATLLRKRAELEQQRAELLTEYEAKLKPLVDRIVAIDEVLAQARRLCEEPV